MIALDHVAFGASDRDAAAEALESLGFTCSAPSRCDWEVSGSRYSAEATCVVFAHQYLDFIEISDPKWDEHLSSSPVYRRGAAPTGVVLSGIQPVWAHASMDGGKPSRPEPYPITRRLRTDPPIEISYRFLPLQGMGLPLGLISDSSPPLSDILAELWDDRWTLINPLTNWLTKFFVVAALFGLIYDRILYTQAEIAELRS